MYWDPCGQQHCVNVESSLGHRVLNGGKVITHLFDIFSFIQRYLNRVLSARNLLGYEKEGETTGALGTAERERLREVLVEEFGYEEPDISELFTLPPEDEESTED